MLTAHFLDDFLQFCTTASSLVFLDSLADSFFKLISTVSEVLYGTLLIDFSHLLPKIAGTGMDHKVDIPSIILVQLDEMVSTSKRTYGTVDPAGILYFPVAVQLQDEFLGLSVDIHFLANKRTETKTAFPDDFAGRDIGADMLMEGMEINVGKLAEVEDAHATTYVYTYYVGDYLVAKVAGEANYATCSGVNVGHYADFLVGEDID